MYNKLGYAEAVTWLISGPLLAPDTSSRHTAVRLNGGAQFNHSMTERVLYKIGDIQSLNEFKQAWSNTKILPFHLPSLS